MDEQQQIKAIERKFYSRSDAAQIARFIEAYRRTFETMWRRADEEYLKRIKDEGKTLSCKSGCSDCCFMFIQTSLGHGIVIVDYLYTNPQKLQAFVKNYRHLNKDGLRITEEFDEDMFSRIRTKTFTMTMTPLAMDLTDKYFDLQIPCPFLVDSRCSIYKVRPMVCAAHRTTNPALWCAKDNIESNKTEEILPFADDLNRLRQLSPPIFSVYQLNAPRLIHMLLTEGLDAVLKKTRTDLSINS
jgi:Fe-S-cluster containining protein